MFKTVSLVYTKESPMRDVFVVQNYLARKKINYIDAQQIDYQSRSDLILHTSTIFSTQLAADGSSISFPFKDIFAVFVLWNGKNIVKVGKEKIMTFVDNFDPQV